MNKEFQLIILSMPKSPRLFLLENRLKQLRIKNYKVFYGNNGSTKKKRDIVYSYYNQEKVEKFIGRTMTFNEIGAEYTYLRAYRYIVKNKILNAIVMPDDMYPSALLKKWIYLRIYLKGLNIISFFCPPNGFFKKIPEYKFANKRIFLHRAKTHVYASNCIQVNYDFCKHYLKKTKNKVIGLTDFPFNFKKEGIKIFETLPYLVYPNDRGYSYIREERNKNEKPLISIKLKSKMTKYKFMRKIMNLMRTFYYLSFIPFFFKKCSFDYYKEYFFDKYKISFINFFSNKYIDTYQIYVDKKNYPKDLTKFIHHFY